MRAFQRRQSSWILRLLEKDQERVLKTGHTLSLRPNLFVSGNFQNSAGSDPLTTESPLTTEKSTVEWMEEKTTRLELWSTQNGYEAEESTTSEIYTTSGTTTLEPTQTTQNPETRFNPIDKAAFFGNPGAVLFLDFLNFIEQELI